MASRLSGFSTPIFGVQWEPPKVDVDVAFEILTHLENCRVLYYPYDAEDRNHVVQSVLQIRRVLNDAIAAGGLRGELSDHLRAMRSACIRFLDAVGVDPDGGIYVPDLANSFAFNDFILNQSLGVLRGTFGLRIAAIGTVFGLEPEEGLATILPEDSSD